MFSTSLFQIIKESLIIGSITSIIGIIIIYIFDIIFKKCNYYTLFLSLFIIGILVHIICEISGINKWFYKNQKIEIYNLTNFDPEIINPAYIRN